MVLAAPPFDYESDCYSSVCMFIAWSIRYRCNLQGLDITKAQIYAFVIRPPMLLMEVSITSGYVGWPALV